MSEAISKCKLSKQGLRLDVCLYVLGILVSICLCPAFSIAEAATLGRIEITTLFEGNNVASQCFGVATNQKTSDVHFLKPSGGAIAAEVPPGTYDVVVTLGAGKTTAFSMLRITVVSGEVSRQTAILAAALYPGAFGGDTGEDEFDDKPWGDDTSDDGDSDDDGSGYDDYYDSGGCDDHDDRPYDDHGKGQDRDGEGLDIMLIPYGNITLRWTARYKALVTEDSHHEYEDAYAFAPGGTNLESSDNLEIVFSGAHTWKVTGVTDSIVDLEEVSGELSWSGSGSGEISEIERRTIQCYKDRARLLQPYDRQVEHATNSSWNYTAQKPKGASPPAPVIYMSRWYEISFAQLRDLGVSGYGETVFKTEDCEGTRTETLPMDSALGPAFTWCELTIADAFSNQEFRYQLRGECNIDTPWEAFAVSGHGAWRLDESHTRTNPDGLGQARCERHGVVDISYALSFIPDEPVIPIVPLVPPEETGSDSDEPEWPVVPLVPPKD